VKKRNYSSFSLFKTKVERCTPLFRYMLCNLDYLFGHETYLLQIQISCKAVYIAYSQKVFFLVFCKIFTISERIGVLGFDSQLGLGIFLFTTTSRMALGSTHPPLQWVQGALSLAVKWPGHEAEHSPPSSTKIKE
jgi:hypothetical protein